MRWFKKKKYIGDIRLDFNKIELKKKVKILVVDDEQEQFPTKHLQESGYTIEWWREITPEKLERMESGHFDIIFLDIKGIANKNISETDGLGIIKRLKTVNPFQIVIAFSGHSYDLSKTEFWRLADDTLAKPVTIIKAKELIDRIIEERITIEHYWRAIYAVLQKNGVSEKKIRKVEVLLVDMIENRNVNPYFILEKIHTTLQNSAAIVTLIEGIKRIWI